MRKWLGLALASFLVVLAATTIYSGNVQTATADDYSHRMMQSHTGDMPIASGAVAQTPTVPVTAEKVSYGSIDGKPLTGYLARPTDATAPLPGIIVIHEWWGLNENIETMTQRLAGEGYAALAVDLYEGQVAENPDQARGLTQAVSQNPQRAGENLRQAYQYLDTEQQAPKIASLGWCFGGSWSLQTALLLPTELDAAVIYYGGQLVTDADRLRALEMPILGLFGSLDDNPPVETVRQFESALKTVGKSPEIHIYEGADHAFANPSGTRYNADAAEDAWKRTTAFLAQHLKS
ncbi:dienelactone hydrolase family protein [Phormidium tenue FACHB-886]|nr:dienelactone hydrolase family protein [Phormidium tenue FACHB-886]